MPNAFAPGSDPQTWTFVSRYDFFGNVVERASADLGSPKDQTAPQSAQMVYDRAGRLRAHQTP